MSNVYFPKNTLRVGMQKNSCYFVMRKEWPYQNKNYCKKNDSTRTR